MGCFDRAGSSSCGASTGAPVRGTRRAARADRSWGASARPPDRAAASLTARAAAAQARLKPFTWASHYVHRHGAIHDFMRRFPGTFYFLPDMQSVFLPDAPAQPSRTSSQGARAQPQPAAAAERPR
jgi:hypothetical protein